MSNEPIESKAIEDVRRWRREVYEERKGLSLAERQRRDQQLLEELGLSHRVIAPKPTPRGAAPDRRAAG